MAGKVSRYRYLGGKKFRENGCTAPFVVLTGMSPEAYSHADAAGFADYLIKPVDQNILVSSVAKLAVENVIGHAA